jgi:SpoVK/Ycf46/Vps4 family AAA+-type ATPase
MRVTPFYCCLLCICWCDCRQVRSALAFAAASGPIIILLDDMHALGNGSSVGGGGGSGNRAVGVLCGILDDLSASLSSRASRVFMVATTAKPESVHASLRRPGRLEKGDLIFVKFDFVPFFANLFSMF